MEMFSKTYRFLDSNKINKNTAGLQSVGEK